MSPKVTESHKEQRRLEILNAAETVFKRKGYEATTMQDIIDESGMSRGGVYLYFSGKEDLMRALHQAGQRDEQSYAEVLAQTKTVWEAAENLLDAQMNETMQVENSLLPVIYEFILSGRNDRSKIDYLMDRYQTALRSFEAFIAAGVERGEFSPLVPPETIGRTLISLFDGVMVAAFFAGPEQVDVKGQFAVLKESLRHLLQVKTPSQAETE